MFSFTITPCEINIKPLCEANTRNDVAVVSPDVNRVACVCGGVLRLYLCFGSPCVKKSCVWRMKLHTCLLHAFVGSLTSSVCCAVAVIDTVVCLHMLKRLSVLRSLITYLSM